MFCTVAGETAVVEASIDGTFLKSRPSFVKDEDAYRFCQYVHEQTEIAERDGRASRTHFPAPSERGWKGGYRHEHWHIKIGEIPKPPWLSSTEDPSQR